jgi:hypothetical protein
LQAIAPVQLSEKYWHKIYRSFWRAKESQFTNGRAKDFALMLLEYLGLFSNADVDTLSAGQLDSDMLVYVKVSLPKRRKVNTSEWDNVTTNDVLDDDDAPTYNQIKNATNNEADCITVCSETFDKPVCINDTADNETTVHTDAARRKVPDGMVICTKCDRPLILYECSSKNICKELNYKQLLRVMLGKYSQDLSNDLYGLSFETECVKLVYVNYTNEYIVEYDSILYEDKVQFVQLLNRVVSIMRCKVCNIRTC